MTFPDRSALRWRDLRSSFDAWTDLEPAPHSNRGFSEMGQYIFESSNPECAVYIDDEPLSGSNVLAWQPRFFAGEVRAEVVRRDGSVAAIFLLDVSPDPKKVGREV